MSHILLSEVCLSDAHTQSAENAGQVQTIYWQQSKLQKISVQSMLVKTFANKIHT